MAPTSKQLNGSLPLQLCLYYNAWFSLVYGIILVYLSAHKSFNLQNLDFTQSFLMPFSTFIWCGTEIARCWFGYHGNLKEKVPQLSAFVLFSCFPQAPCLLYLSFGQTIRYPVEFPLGVVGLIFLVVEIWLAKRALYHFIDRQTAGFLRLQQTDGEKQDWVLKHALAVVEGVRSLPGDSVTVCCKLNWINKT